MARQALALIEKESGARIQEPGETTGILEDWNNGVKTI